MRISDWSSDVGSSDLGNLQIASMFEFKAGDFTVHNLSHEFRQNHAQLGRNTRPVAEIEAVLLNPASTAAQRLEAARSEERRVGKACVRTCRSRWTPDP